MKHVVSFVVVLLVNTAVVYIVFTVFQNTYRYSYRADVNISADHPYINFRHKSWKTEKSTTTPRQSFAEIQNNGCSVKRPEKDLYPENGKGKTERKERSYSFPTNYLKSVVEIINPQKLYNVCDNIAIRIQARGANGSMKSYGGDYFRPKFFTQKPYSAIGPDYFFDYDNGTYLALFTLRWTGTVGVSVLLVHPSEAVEILNRTTEGSASTVFTFFGEFKTKAADGESYSEKVTCGVAPFKPPLCNMSANHTHGPWFCMQPTNEKLSCKDWTSISLNANSPQKLQKTLTSQELKLFERTKVQLDTSLLPLIKVGAGSNHHPVILPTCTPVSVPSTIETMGYFHSNTWQPFNCRVKHFEKDLATSCVHGKHIHIYGDSTGRQMYDYLKDKKKNQSINFGFHGPPVRGRQVTMVNKLRYIAEQIDELQGGPNVIIVFSIWAHFGMPEGTFYRNRLEAIKGAVDRLWQRSPETRVIVRSANTREHSIGGFILISSDWIALQGEKTLRDVFSKDKRFSFLDAWDMTLVQKSTDYIHPHQPTLIQIMDYLLTTICV